ncbi:MAG: cyclic nucleotide-binding domain-containing protein [Acidobacteriota bacterium]|nr:MAG: cyclic nucleotide-binding domain-containing protein [Acidobacteriota bacterium]
MTQMLSTEVLRRLPYFAGVHEESLRKVAMISEERSFSAGDILFREGEPATHLFLIVSGEVDIQLVMGDGEHRTADTLVAGDLIVWSSLVEPFRTRFHGVARKDTSVIAIEAKSLRALLETDMTLGYRMMSGVANALSHRLAGARVQLASR